MGLRVCETEEGVTLPRVLVCEGPGGRETGGLVHTVKLCVYPRWLCRRPQFGHPDSALWDIDFRAVYAETRLRESL